MQVHYLKNFYFLWGKRVTKWGGLTERMLQKNDQFNLSSSPDGYLLPTYPTLSPSSTPRT